LKKLIIIFLFCSSLPLFAQLEISAQLRPRVEYRNGYRFPIDSGATDAFFISQRTRLNLSYTDTLLETYLSLQDVRVWGDEAILSDDPSFGLAAGWIGLKLKHHFHLRAGRQELSFADQRLIGPAEWRQQARSHDALLIGWNSEQWKLQLAAAFNQNAERLASTSYGLNQYKAMTVLYAERTKGALTGHFLGIADGIQNLYSGGEEMDWRFTNGVQLQYQYNSWNFKLGGYTQNGVRFLNGRTIRAHMLHAGITYKINNITIEGTYDLLSGQDTSATYTAFDNLYASRHRFYGFMDYYTSFPFDMKEGGLQALALQFQYNQKDKHIWRADIHHFLLDEPVLDVFTGVASGRQLGNELDLLYTYNLREDIHISLGHSFYFPGEDLDLIKGGDTRLISTFSYLMLDVHPSLFKSIRKNEL
jgi:hypothetical protein